MSTPFFRRDERGVAMVTVLFVGAVLTAVATAASFVVVTELQSGSSDRRGTQALSFAEAGIDRLALELRRGAITWGLIRESGCKYPPYEIPNAQLGNGTYRAELSVYNPELAPDQRTPPVPWSASNDTSALACQGRSDDPRVPQYFAITSEGQRPTGRRVVRQVVTIAALNLPVGVYADRVDVNGTVGMLSISLISPGDIIGREKIGFTGLDPYYRLGDFYSGESMSVQIPAGAHAKGSIYYVAGGGKLREHPPNPNCTANTRGTAGQSVWDGSFDGSTLTAGCPTWPVPAGYPRSFPPTSKFTQSDLSRVAPTPTLAEEDFQTLKQAAKDRGLYCYIPNTGSATCQRPGTAGAVFDLSLPIQTSDLATLPKNFVAYFEFQSGGDPFSKQIKWKATAGACNSDPLVNSTVTIVVRNGGMSMENGASINGAVFAPEGRFDSSGNFRVNGTVIAKEFRIRGGATLSLDRCWVDNMPAAFLGIQRARWLEVDR